MIEITKTYGKRDPIIQRSDGLFINIDTLVELDSIDKKVVESMFYPKISELTDQELAAYTDYLVLHLFISTNSKKSKEERSQFTAFFRNELLMYAPEMSIQEVKTICFHGITGKYSNDSIDSNLTVANFIKWKSKYLEFRNKSTLNVMNKINSISNLIDFDFSKIILKINELIDLRKTNLNQYEIEVLNFTRLIPEFIYSQLVENKFLKFDLFKKFKKESKQYLIHSSEKPNENNISRLVETIIGSDLKNFDSKVEKKAKQLCIINFINNQHDRLTK